MAISLTEFARSVLLGTTLEEKLLKATVVEDEPASMSAFEAPSFPGRPEKLLRLGNSKFPAANQLKHETTRGQVLHFFANHELLAMELMALVLLKFPEAPQSFRMGLVRTIQEEQSHMRLYLARMRDLGVDFGDLPLTDYFWNCLKNMRSPLEFVTQMSLTFEQANLDFSLYYRDEIAKHGDEKTAAILERVYREEIGHVKHGLTWFNRWRENADTESDWDAYKRLLPLPLTPRRAKGTKFFADVRREIGFSEKFIEELEINSGSKGRPPLVWIYNPNCDAEIVRGKPGFTAPKHAQLISEDLEPLLMMLAREADLLWVKKRPRVEWLKQMSKHGFDIPQFVDANEIRDPKLTGFEPWGWSPEVFEKLQPLKGRVVENKDARGLWSRDLLSKPNFEATGLGKFFSKSWDADFLRLWLQSHPETLPFFGAPDLAGVSAHSKAEVLRLLETRLSTGLGSVLKAPYGTSGNQVKRVRDRKDLESGTLSGWIENTLETQKTIIVEPLLEKLHDLSIQIELGDGVTLLEAREFLTDALWQYRGTLLGRSFWRFSPEVLRFFNEALPHWQRFAKDLGRALIEGGYQGPAGIDALIWKGSDGKPRLKPLIELNPRWTMGRVALALEDHIVPGTRAAWMILKKGATDLSGLLKQHPPRFVTGENGHRLESGVFATTDPTTANEVYTSLFVGESALQTLFVL